MIKRDISFEAFITMGILKTRAVILGAQAVLEKNVHLVGYLLFVDRELKAHPDLFTDSVLNHINKVMAVWRDNPSAKDINSSTKWLMKQGFSDGSKTEKEKNNE